MKTRKVVVEGEEFTITEHEPIRQGSVVLYQDNTGRSRTYPDGVLRLRGKWYPVRTITEPQDSLIMAICEIGGRFDIVGIAWALSYFNLTLADCMEDNSSATLNLIIEKSNLNMNGYPKEQVEAVREMAEATKGTRAELFYNGLMRAVDSARP